ncbi:MAG: hypothetical protein Q8P73_02065 [bacterium]|nr:hypothetical protein [bacterium]
MESQDKTSKFRTFGQSITFVLISMILISAVSNRIILDWRGFVFLVALQVILVVPWISEINFFDLFRIKTSINNIDDKLESIKMKLESTSNAQAQNITYVNTLNPENFLRQKEESETGGSSIPETKK